MTPEILDRISALAREVVGYAGLEFVHLDAKREPGGFVLRLYIDKPGGVTLDDCARVSRQISAQLDVEDPIEGHYTLEVSSPGLDRPLFEDGDFVRFAGRQVSISTSVPLDGQRNFQGRLEGLEDGSVLLTLQGGRLVTIPRGQVTRARLQAETQAPDTKASQRGRRA